jgi:low-density lipoprotein receptor class B
MTSSRALPSAVAISIAAIVVVSLLFSGSADASVYWANGAAQTIGRANLDGTQVNQSFIGGATNPCGVALDGAHVYWGNVGSGTIGRANLNGSGVNQGFISNLVGPCGAALDGTHIYWADTNGGAIGRANLDGSGVNQGFIANVHTPCGIAVDGAHVYWGDSSDGTIARANLDGTGVNQSFIGGATGPCGVAVDGGHVYWTNQSGTTIGRANLNGSGVNQSFIAGATNPCGVAVDGGHVYWPNSINGTIGRANLDGTGVNQAFVGGASRPCGAAVDAVDVGYPRPLAATPLRVSLVPTFNPCINPNRTHGAPLAFGSCAPPVQTSSFLTVGTSDANGAAANSVGSVTFRALNGDPATPADEADLKLIAKVTDVRLKAGLGDYTGELQANARLRITDRASGPGVNEPATVQDFIFRFTVPCQTTLSTTIGSTCAVTTTADAIAPGTVREKARTIWQLAQIELFDGGPDGLASTASGNTLFETQGVFVP